MHKGYYAIIPADVRYNNELTPNAKLLYGEITALCNEKGYCWASNSYFAELYKVSKETVSRWIGKLEKQGYIRIEMIYEQGTKSVKERRIYISSDPIDKNINRYRQNNQYPIDENINTPIDENVKDNNTSIINNTINNTLDINKDNVPFAEIIDYLNQLAETNYRVNNKKTKQLINARWKEGFRLNDFKTVIEKKVYDWKDDPKMSQYLRPNTLFGTKFEGYLNQKVPVKKQQYKQHKPSKMDMLKDLYNKFDQEEQGGGILDTW